MIFIGMERFWAFLVAFAAVLSMMSCTRRMDAIVDVSVHLGERVLSNARKFPLIYSL